MRRFRATVRVVAAVFPLLLASCTVESTHPLSDPDQSKPAIDVSGIWTLKNNDGIAILLIGPAHETSTREGLPAGIMRLAASSIDSNNLVATPEEIVFFVTRLKSGNYLNWFDEKSITADSKKPWKSSVVERYTIMKYAVVADKLELRFANRENAARDIESGKVQGSVKRDNKKQLKFVQLTDTTENLQKYIENGGDRNLFPHDDEKIVFDRLRIAK